MTQYLKTSTQSFVVSCAAMATLVLALFLHGCGARSGPLPPELEGTWRTQAQGYAANFLRITPQVVAFGTDGTPATEYPIAQVAPRADEDGDGYTITYLDESGRELTLVLSYSAAYGGMLTFTHQSHLRWTKEREHS